MKFYIFYNPLKCMEESKCHEIFLYLKYIGLNSRIPAFV